VVRQSSSSFVLVSADRTDSSCGELVLDLLTLFEDENEDEDEQEQNHAKQVPAQRAVPTMEPS
jgi:hypothetical protein